MKKEMTYQKAFEELSQIVAEIENENVPLDQLAARITRASELIGFCRDKLRETEEHFRQSAGKIKK